MLFTPSTNMPRSWVSGLSMDLSKTYIIEHIIG